MVKKDFEDFIFIYILYFCSHKRVIVKNKSRQNAENSTVAKSLPKKWVILPKSFV